MSREIKFRAWTGATMEYNVTAGKFGTFYVNPGAKGDGLDEKDSACLTPFNTIYPKQTQVMQYTGLTDKNGKEIYEGDIVKYRAMNNIPYRRAHIRILGGGATANALETKIDTTDGYIYALSNEREFPITQSEIIGNIYETPELLPGYRGFGNMNKPV